MKKLIVLAVTAVMVLAIALPVWAGTPFYGSPLKIGDGVTFIEACDFDKDGKDVSYSSNDEGIKANYSAPDWSYREDGWPTEKNGGVPERDGKLNLTIGWMTVTDWAVYTVDVAVAGKYSIYGIGGTAADHAVRVGLYWDGAPLTYFMVASSDWATYDPHDAADVVYLGAGTHEFKWAIEDETNGINLDAIVFTLVEADTGAGDSSSGSDSSSGGKDVPVTGDAGMMASALAAFALSVAFAGVVAGRKRRVN